MSSIVSKPGRNQNSFAPLARPITPGASWTIGFEPDVIVECTGVGSVIADSIQKIGAGGVVCLTGVGAGGSLHPGHSRRRGGGCPKKQCDRRQREREQADTGTKRNDRFGRLDRAWLCRLITRYEKPENFKQALKRTPNDIKVVIQFSEI